MKKAIMCYHNTKQDKNNGAIKEHISLHAGSTVPVQREDGRPWTHKAITEQGNEYHNDRSY